MRGSLGGPVSVLAAALAVLLVACGDNAMPTPAPVFTPLPAATATPEVAPTPTFFPSESVNTPINPPFDAEDAALLDTTHPLDGKPAPDFTGVSGWINTEPFSLADLRGRVVLLDFWTYTCINCIRTFPFVKSWHDRYRDVGLVVIGIHSPEFAFEKKYENVLKGTQDFGIEYPVVQDNDWAIWEAFRNTAWPGKYLIDAEGNVQQVTMGEGGYVAVEQGIRYWLQKAGYSVEHIRYTPDDFILDPEIVREAHAIDREDSRTRELYAGLKRNIPFRKYPPPLPYILYDHYYDNPDTDQLYEDPDWHSNHHIYFQGLWHNYSEYMRHTRVTSNLEDYVAIKYNAKTVNVVVGNEKDEPYVIRVTWDGKPIPKEVAEPDVRWDSEGNSYLLVDEPRMYRLIRTVEYEKHQLKLASNSDDFSLYTFTFGYYKELEDN
ncbi:MAG: redoxin domain-containing protein [SAR202 cluster bacterium]|nr:redoxin domain-containing protein [SAR202 cluster bacterium]